MGLLLDAVLNGLPMHIHLSTNQRGVANASKVDILNACVSSQIQDLTWWQRRCSYALLVPDEIGMSDCSRLPKSPHVRSSPSSGFDYCLRVHARLGVQLGADPMVAGC